MKTTQETVWAKLKQDVARYVVDYSLSSPVKLLFVVDFWPIILLRLEEWVSTLSKISKFFLNIILLCIRPFIIGMAGTRLITGVTIGGGLLLHQSIGIAVASEVIIGKNCTIFCGAGVVHLANGQGEGAAVIGDNVKLMAGCKVIGPVKIGNNAIVGANAVVLNDVPDNCVAVGVPARIIPQK